MFVVPLPAQGINPSETTKSRTHTFPGDPVNLHRNPITEDHIHHHTRKIPVTVKVTGTVHLLQVIVCLKKTLRPHREGPTEWEGFLKTDNDAYLFRAVATSTAQATVHPTIGLLPIPRKPIISTCAGTDEEPANCASECIRPMVSVRAWVVDSR